MLLRLVFKISHDPLASFNTKISTEGDGWGSSSIWIELHNYELSGDRVLERYSPYPGKTF